MIYLANFPHACISTSCRCVLVDVYVLIIGISLYGRRMPRALIGWTRRMFGASRLVHLQVLTPSSSHQSRPFEMVSSRVHTNDVQRLFLQAMMSRRIMSDNMIKLLWQKCTKAVKRKNNYSSQKFGIVIESLFVCRCCT